MHSFKITILGCGSSSGVPRANGDWGKCNPNNAKNRRQRSSLLVQYNNKNVIIDTTPDFRNQMIGNNVKHLDAILYTHPHADHVFGIHDTSFMQNKANIPIYGSRNTLSNLILQFPYLFLHQSAIEIITNFTKSFCDYAKKSFIDCHIIEKEFELFQEKVICFDQYHGDCISTGFRFKNFAYCTDVFEFSDHAINNLFSLDLLIISCTNYVSHNNKHASFEKVMNWREKFNSKLTILTHMGVDMDYDEISSIIPNNVLLAYDKMEIFV
ncbi:MBL fold metallo-hydrolase [Candidatus Gromoviella agglomerans]|uniref:MBL fold metallo-hydrolase n=1 Tax=Candidatus Gromoviella agglomerans TaxID=2806609 RepID=UPI001E2A23A8|nr:MBL fold metallo-hydrolase [Candidatus Gromoviella agglomerans]UFX98581.1 MBL fold metallo-hydrolase [Candidatus Gromoviella agglomerans]